MQLPLDAITTIFIFMIGLPAILLQTLPPEIRRTVLQERKHEVVLFTVGPLCLATLFVGLGVWLTYRSDPGDPNAAKRAELLWLGLVAALLMVSGSSALVFTDRWRRINVVDHLHRAARRGIAKLGRPVEHVVHSLVDLGIQSQAGQDKGMVIHALAELTRETQRHDAYDGSQLEHVIKGLEDLFVAGNQQCSVNNFLASANLLEELIMESGSGTHRDDLEAAIQTTSLLGRASLEHEQSHVQIKFLDALGWAGDSDDPTWATQALLDLGSCALEHGYVLIAMTALDKMETVIGKHCPVQGELAEDFIGLLAHFWAHEETGRRYSTEYLVHADRYFTAPLPDVIREARDRSMKKARFATCNHLTRMLADDPLASPDA